jgi:putative ABC transport system permease protein
MLAALRSVRILRRHWKLTAIAAFSLSVALALGIVGLSISNTVLILAPAAPAPDRLAMIYERSNTNAIEEISYPDYQYYRQNNHVFTDLAAAPNSINVLGDFNFQEREVSLVARPVSENYFDVLGIHPYLGRFFAPGDDASIAKISVMTYSCWKRLGADPHIVGKVLAGNTILGVTPREFTGAFYGFDGDLFLTLASFDNSPWRTQRTARQLSLTGRLKPGVTRRQAQAEMATLAGQLASAYPKEDKGREAVVARATLLPADAIPTAELMTAILMALVLLVLLIACANVANLLLAVAVGRRQEAAIKLALGAGRGRLVREFLAESAILCTISGVLGYLIAAAAITRFSNFSVEFPTMGVFSLGLHLRMDSTVVAFALVLTMIASLATGLAPALYASSPGLAQILGGEIVVGGTRKGARRNALVIVQVAVCTLVLVGMGLCQRNLYNLRHIDLGFPARNLVANTVYLEAEGYDEARGKQLYGRLRSAISALPGVEAVALAEDLPLLGASQMPVQFPDGRKTASVADSIVDQDYFSTLGMRVLAGRVFNSSDRENSPAVAVVNQKMADIFWPGEDPVGKVILAGEPAQKVIVVGVAPTGKYVDLDESPQPFLYLPLSQHYVAAINVMARTKSDPRLWIEPLAKAVRGLGLHVLIQPVTLNGWMTLTLLRQRIAAGCVAMLSALGLLLAVIGLFGAISYSVSERKKELGIRVALGALPWQLLQMVLRQTMFVAGAGVAIGIVLGVVATIVFRSQLYGIAAVEWSVLIPAGSGMLLLSLMVAYLSARPWITIDPMDAVRHA